MPRSVHLHPKPKVKQRLRARVPNASLAQDNFFYNTSMIMAGEFKNKIVHGFTSHAQNAH
jgi:hypothetical protein